MTKSDLRVGQILLPASKLVRGFDITNLSEFKITKYVATTYDTYEVRVHAIRETGETGAWSNIIIGSIMGYYNLKEMIQNFKLKNNSCYEIY